ncbi:MAG: hypothetical protein WBA23_09555 [Tunicatimonas sp.]|uniref:hypothetical protein n=1 Tax=Tunicatimonas sp. TaxID=1940096 RepID=UPI003C75A3BF
MPTAYSILLISSIIILLSTCPAFGQQSASSWPSNELGISLISYASRPSGHLRFERTFYAHPLQGVSYKRHLGRSAIRLSVARQELTKRQSNQASWSSEGSYEATLVKIGWERSFTANGFSPYAGIDLMGIQSSSEGSFGGGITAAYYGFTAERRGLGVSPTVGVRYRLLRWVSLFAETALDVFYAHRRGDYTQIGPSTIPSNYPEVDKGFEGKFNPVATFAINVAF